MKFSIIKLLSFFSLAFITSCRSGGQENKLDKYMTDLVNRKKISGAAVAVIKGDEILFTNNYGYADIENKMTVKDSTQFHIMSVTKNFIAFAVVQLADKKIVELDAPVRKYLDKLPSQYDSVLVYQLLSHTAGVPDYVEIPGYMAQANRNQTPWQVLTPILDRPLVFKPGEKSAYCNSGYFLLGLMIEKVTGITLGAYLKKMIFNPLGMNNTYLDDNSSPAKLRAKGYIAYNGELKEIALLNPSQYWAAGGIITPKTDMIKWDKAMKKGSLLPSNEINQMMRPAKLSNGSSSEFGLGFELMSAPDMKIAGNNGAGSGFNAANLQFLNDSLTVIVLTNTSGSNSTMIAKNIRDIVINKTVNAQVPTPTNKDRLDSLVMRLFNDVQKGVVNSPYFTDKDALAKFNSDNLNYLHSLGKLTDIEQKGEKKNPQSIVRKYQIRFEKGGTDWVIIFSTDGKVMIANHM